MTKHGEQKSVFCEESEKTFRTFKSHRQWRCIQDDASKLKFAKVSLKKIDAALIKIGFFELSLRMKRIF